LILLLAYNAEETAAEARGVLSANDFVWMKMSASRVTHKRYKLVLHNLVCIDDECSNLGLLLSNRQLGEKKLEESFRLKIGTAQKLPSAKNAAF